MEIEGRLTIDLNIESGCVHSVGIGSSRPVGASRIFHGKRVEEVLKTVPMLFSICATAQACAGVHACEQALGVRPTPRIEQMRLGLVNMENLREHLWRIFLDWPEFLHETTQRESMAEVLVLQKGFRTAVTNGHNPFLQPGDSLEIDLQMPDELKQKIIELLEQKVFGMAPSEWLQMEHAKELVAWTATKTTVAARMLDYVIQTGWSDSGTADIEALPTLEPDQLYAMLEDDAFIQRPHWSGLCRETTTLTRVDSPLLQQLRGLYGNGLLVRLVARLTEIVQISNDLFPGEVDMNFAEMNLAIHSGIGQIAAARGQLVHRVDLTDGYVSMYQILAPTEWNFHPKGVVSMALDSLKGSREQIEQQARLLINAIDPCVGYELNM